MVTKEKLTQLLNDAKTAHTEYEKTTGQPDTNWPAWYASYIVEKMEAEEFGAFSEGDRVTVSEGEGVHSGKSGMVTKLAKYSRGVIVRVRLDDGREDWFSGSYLTK